MAPLTDAQLLDCFKEILDNWNFTGYVTMKDTPLEWVKKNLLGLDVKKIAKLMYDHVAAGEEIDQVKESRPEWSTREYHYDFRIQILGKLRYIETVLVDDNPKDPTIDIVSIHDA